MMKREIIKQSPGRSDEFGNGDNESIKYVSSCNSPEMLSMPLRIDVGFEAWRHGEGYCRHRNYPVMALELMLDGGANYESEEEKFRLEPGGIALFHRNRNSFFSTGKNDYYHKLVLILCGTLLDSMITSLGLEKCSHLFFFNMSDIESRFRKIMNMVNEKRPGNEKIVSCEIYFLLLELSENYQKMEFKSRPAPLQKVLSYLEHSLSQVRRISDLSAVAGVSHATLVRLFNTHLHSSPTEYLLNLRMKRAENLLSSSKRSIKEIAWECGFENPLYFSTVFTKRHSYSPRQFRIRACHFPQEKL